MSELDIDTRGIDELVSRMSGAPQALARRMVTTMRASLAVFEEAVAVETPVGATGNLRGSIAGDVYGKPLEGEFIGKLTTSAVYGYVVEFGRRPGARRPPTEPLEYWAVRVLGVSSEDAPQVAAAISWKIGRYGIPGKFMFRKGFDARRSAVINLWEQMMSDLAVEVF